MQHRLTKAWICEIMGIPVPAQDEEYTKLGFAHDVKPGGVAILSVNTSSPDTKTTPERAVELADQAMERGAKLLLNTFQVKDYPCLIVDDVFEAFCRIAGAIRDQYPAKAISVTGSIGKTTTTQMVYAVLSAKYNTHRNDSSANNVRLVAEVLQRLKPEHEYYVQETMEGPPFGAAGTISRMIKPSAAIITVVGTSHMEFFKTQERIMESCLGVQDGMPEDGLLIMNGDDPFQWGAKCDHAVVYYAINNKEADYHAENIRAEGISLRFDVVHGAETTPVRIHCFGTHNILNALAAFAAGEWAGMTHSEIVKGLDSFQTMGIRQNYVVYGGKHLFLDCYNATPESMQSAFNAMSMISVQPGGKRVAVFADIAEVGEHEKEYHLKVGKSVTESCIDKLICYGKNARYTASVALAESSIPVFHASTQDELVDYLQRTITDEDLVLFKGSNVMSLEHAVDRAFGTWFHEEFERYKFQSSQYSDSSFRYQIYTDHATVVEKLDFQADVVIPSQVQGKPVTGLGRSLFNQSKSTETVSLPDTLINIRYCTFYNSKIKSIRIPASVRIIDRSAFNSCKQLKQVIIEDGCTHIGYRAFSNCPELSSISIPASVHQIEDEAFSNCSKLTIYGVSGSYAEKYAKSHKILFESK